MMLFLFSSKGNERFGKDRRICSDCFKRTYVQTRTRDGIIQFLHVQTQLITIEMLDIFFK
jgi:hypothetical protein